MKDFSAYIADSFQGTTHTENQDGILIVTNKDYSLFAVFDGVSMAKNPRKGVELSIDFVSKHHSKYYSGKDFGMEDIMYDCHYSLVKSGVKEPLTTCCMLWLSITNGRIKYSHCGDSRIYSFTEGIKTQLTVDDVLYPNSNILTRCFGSTQLTRSEFYEQNMQSVPHYILLCTDGFYHLFEDVIFNIYSVLDLTDSNDTRIKIENKVKGYNRDDASYVLIDLAKFNSRKPSEEAL